MLGSAFARSSSCHTVNRGPRRLAGIVFLEVETICSRFIGSHHSWVLTAKAPANRLKILMAKL
jgi:hypothetical protein